MTKETEEKLKAIEDRSEDITAEDFITQAIMEKIEYEELYEYLKKLLEKNGRF